VPVVEFFARTAKPTLLLGNSDEHYSLLALPSRGLQVGTSQFLFVLSLLETAPTGSGDKTLQPAHQPAEEVSLLAV